ncbi:uncharacterized protein G2W53_027355 [Senna tora]|uniref:Helitron helicase-like domain-containing protein n=1 Tax=Senna tora TaxID=362788 RepID=A0A834WFZ5_9FABA|nr:uncharacterized protein G2W53_027355 [Senna tora]
MTMHQEVENQGHTENTAYQSKGQIQDGQVPWYSLQYGQPGFPNVSFLTMQRILTTHLQSFVLNPLSKLPGMRTIYLLLRGTFINNNMSLMYYNRAHVARGRVALRTLFAVNDSKTATEGFDSNITQICTVEVDFADSKFNEEYWDIGLPTYECQFCGAMFWYEERLNRSRATKNPKFSLCCMQGKVKLPPVKKPPTFLENLFTNKDSRSSHFMKEIRNYNMFAFTSMGGKIDHSINQGKRPYVFRIQGQNMHMLGSLLPPNGERPKFSQLYIYDTENEVSNRVKNLSSSRENNQFDASIVLQISQLLDSCNPLVKQYQTVKDHCRSSNTSNLRLKLIRKRNSDARTYNLPTASEVAALIVGDIDLSTGERDIIVENKYGVLQHIDELHPLYLPMQYPLLFPYGEDGYRPDTLY